MIPIPFLGWLSVDEEDTDTMLREQIHAQNCEIKALRTALLYAHNKELTDEEIEDIWLEIRNKAGDIENMRLAFARAILEKAQGK